MRVALHPTSDGFDMVKKDPCNETKEDVCKSVRDRMISIQASPPTVETFSYGFLTVPPLAGEVSEPAGFMSTSQSLRTSFLHSLERPLFLSYSVLRI
jgi:hypothetical protein